MSPEGHKINTLFHQGSYARGALSCKKKKETWKLVFQFLICISLFYSTLLEDLASRGPLCFSKRYVDIFDNIRSRFSKNHDETSKKKERRLYFKKVRKRKANLNKTKEKDKKTRKKNIYKSKTNRTNDAAATFHKSDKMPSKLNKN